MHDSPSPDRNRSRAPAALQNGNGADDADELENGLLDINALLDTDIREDEWSVCGHSDHLFESDQYKGGFIA